MTFHELLKLRRQARFKVAGHAADAAHVHRSTWFRWELGEHIPTVGDLYLIAETLGVTPNDLLTYQGEFVTIAKQRAGNGA